MNKIIITGSTSGIGKAISENCLAQGYHVIGLARHKTLPFYHPNYTPITCDFKNIDDTIAQFQALTQDHPDVITIIGCAGFGKFAGIESFSLKNIEDLMHVNFTAHALLIRTYLPHLKSNKNSKIIFIGSESALQGAKQGSVYCASKFALRGFCQSLRQDCAKDEISVTMIEPGFTRTNFFDDLQFAPGEAPQNAIDPVTITNCVELVLSTPNTTCIEEIILQPMKKVVKKK